MNKVVVEVGSTVTKVDVFDGVQVKKLKDETIYFKKNYSLENKIKESDFNQLTELVNSLKEEYDDIYVCGTSIFRTLKDEEKKNFLDRFYEQTSINFEIISQDDESKLTVLGATGHVKEKVCVFVGGGGSCEIAIYENGIRSNINIPFGVVDVMNEFPDLKDDIASTSLDKVKEYIRDRIEDFGEKADILILAGGAHEMFARLSGIEYEENTLFQDTLEPIMMTYENRVKETKRYFEAISMDEIRSRVDDPNWWYATRAMCAFVLVVAELTQAKYIIPTNIGIVHGILNEK